jgi:hypothetical protein
LEVTMTNNPESDLRLAPGLLRLYKLALTEGYIEVAEHLLCALEQLAETRPACEPMLDQAYLWGACGRPRRRDT